MLFMYLDLNSLLECFLVNFNMGDDFVYTLKDYTFRMHKFYNLTLKIKMKLILLLGIIKCFNYIISKKKVEFEQ